MTTNDGDVLGLIYEEARLCYPELFGGVALPAPRYSDFQDGADALAAVLGGFDPRPRFLTEAASAPLPDPAADAAISSLDVEAIRADFPILREKINGKDLVWFDNAATTQKPRCVIDRLGAFYTSENSNIHRGAHTLARRATDAYEDARRTAARFLGAGSPDEIVFVRGTTEAINLVASSWGSRFVGADDEILISELEHHANIVPWQLLCRKTGARLRCFPADGAGQIDLAAYGACLTPRTKLVAFSHVSNVLGAVAPAEALIRLAHRAGAVVLVDGAQAVSHLPVDVRALDADFYAFSGHKVFGPTGIGVLYGKYGLLDDMAPYQGGGNMIASVTMEESLYKKPPHRFEAGTNNIAGAIALGSALRYVSGLGLQAIAGYERMLLGCLTEELHHISGLSLVGNPADRSAIVSFRLDGLDSDDVARALDGEGIAVRAGHHCAQPALRRFGLDNAVRASLAVYNTFGEIDRFVRVLKNIGAQARNNTL
jgi:cysteine desulfurase/selenocysteine lyase